VRQPGSAPRSRQQQRKERTRAALVRAAQALLAAGKTDVPIVEITQAADVGMGSFYNHSEGLDDPAEVFACRFRLTGRLHRRQPQLSKVILHNALALAYCDCGLAPRARHDLDAAVQAGRFNVVDPELALAVVVGAVLCLGQLLHDQPDRDDAQATDQVTEDLLRMLGVPAAEARRIRLLPLPDLGHPEPQNAGRRRLISAAPDTAHATG
jgi:Tetracyclin repressor-like, C-terminal domain